LQLSSNLRGGVPRWWLVKRDIYPSWFYRRTNDPSQRLRKALIRLAFSKGLPMAWSTIDDKSKLVSICGMYCGKLGIDTQRFTPRGAKPKPVRTEPFSLFHANFWRDIDDMDRQDLRPVPVEVQRYRVPMDQRESFVPRCEKKNHIMFRIEDESKFKLPIEEAARQRIVDSQPGMYYKIHVASTSGFYTGTTLGEMFPTASRHEREVADRHWASANPFVCDCQFGSPPPEFLGESELTEEELLLIAQFSD